MTTNRALRVTLVATVLTGALVAAVPVASAQTATTQATTSDRLRFGARLGLATGPTDPLIGFEVLIPFTSHVWLNPNVEAIFGDRVDTTTLNFDVHMDVARRDSTTFWLGGGPALVIRKPDRGDRDTDLGLNLLAGAGFLGHGRILPYVQGKVLISDDTRAAVALGVRF